MSRVYWQVIVEFDWCGRIDENDVLYKATSPRVSDLSVLSGKKSAWERR